jgi:hypothetical protein
VSAARASAVSNECIGDHTFNACFLDPRLLKVSRQTTLRMSRLARRFGFVAFSSQTSTLLSKRSRTTTEARAVLKAVAKKPYQPQWMLASYHLAHGH